MTDLIVAVGKTTTDYRVLVAKPSMIEEVIIVTSVNDDGTLSLSTLTSVDGGQG